jgi:hypothetical protein
MQNVNTGLCLPAGLRDLMRRVVRQRQANLGGRASVSSLVSELLQTHESELQAELNGEVQEQELSN